MNKLFLLFLWGVCICCCSCSSHKRLQRGGVNKVELSRQLGFKVAGHDDLRLFREAATWLGTPYRYGGTTRKGVDCSGLAGNIYREVYRYNLSRTVNDIANRDCRRVAKRDLKAGDLVFFNTSKKKKGINHVGVFLKKGYFVHASTSRGVVVSQLKEDYYRKCYKRGGRVKK